MIIYNVTMSIEESIHNEWLDWMKNIHIPEVLATGLFVESKILKLRSPEPEEGFTYAIQYTLNSMAELDTYQTQFAPALRKKTDEKFGGKFHAFRTILETID
ncbi:MAG: DUF4286 family protein [Bacteroidetes bacterium]|mgnify:FL=1|nr:DUF4286 family protein [Bacteroidota bacterium]